MEKTLEELKAEADVLGIKYNPNISATKLSEKIEAYYESQAAGDSVKVQAEPETKVEEVPVKGKEPKEAKWRRIGRELQLKAMKTRVVTVSNNDTRENSVLTADYAGFENEHFSGKAYIIPFNVPIELPQGLIDVLSDVRITLHVDEIVDGKRTGNKVPKRTKKYNISYEDVK